jgi:hypothetical protein
MIRYINLFIAVLLFSSCSDALEGINEDPNSITNSSYGNILTGAGVGNMLFQTGESARRAGIFAGQYTGIDRQHLGFSQYNVTTSDFDGLWYDAYVNAFRNVLVTQESVIENNVGEVSLGITQILQAQIIGTMASLYGDIPFEEAGLIENTNPNYQDQSLVYDQIQDILSEGITNLEANSGRPTAGSEIYFDGNPTSWIESAYTLKARFYIHNKAYDQAYQAATNGISSLQNSMYAPHGTAADNANLNYQFFEIQVRQSDLIVSDFMISLLQPGTENPMPANYRGNSKTDETARFNFYFNSTSNGFQPNTTNGFAAQDAPASLVTFEENLLILAEAGLRSVDFGTGLGHLNDFRALMSTGGYLRNIDAAGLKYDAYTEADFEAGGIENPDGIAKEDALLREILQERYITLFGQIEVFNDTRRTLNTNTVRVPVEPNVGNQLPQRFLYPQTEIERNDNSPTPIPDFFDPTEVNQ